MDQSLIAYYSFSGTTRAFAGAIAAITGGTLFELAPEHAYDFSRNTASKEVRNEIARGFCPKLSGDISTAEYPIIFLGTPNWFKGMAPPLLSFLRSHDFSGKTVVPFCTHGGGGFGGIEKRISEECGDAAVLPGFAGTGGVSGEQIVKWLNEIGLV